jgi:hypothetical protein
MSSPLLDLVRDPAQLGRVVRAMTNIVAASFAEDRSRVTRAEERRRCDLCISLFRVMRAECGYSETRALDELPIALRSRLDGGTWEPSKRSAWTVDAPSERGEAVEVYSAGEEVPREQVLWTPERARLGIVD